MTQAQVITSQIYQTTKIMENTMRLINADTKISNDNKKAIADFLDSKESEGLSPNRLIILAASLRRLAQLTTVSFKQQTEQDARNLIKCLEKTNYKDWTKVTTKKVFKQICRFHRLPSCVYEWLKTTTPPNALRKEDLLTSEEINKLVAAAPNNMWQCLLAVLAETGARPSEILSLTIRQVIQNETHFKLCCLGKMAKKQGERPVFVIKNYTLLKSWISQHPAKNKADAPVFFVKELQPIQLILLDRTIKRAAARAMISKNCFAYLFRHTRATELYSKHPTPLAQKMMGHEDAAMSKVYCHLNDNDVLEALEGGIKPVEAVDFEKCQKCGSSNIYGSMTCQNCHSPLSAAGFIQIEQEKASELEELRQIKAMMPKIEPLLALLEKPEAIVALQTLAKKAEFAQVLIRQTAVQ